MSMNEELRLLNEELSTVNAQLREKVEQLERAHDDLHNLFASTKVATLFLDEQLRVMRFTPAAAELLDLDGADTHRRITDIARELLQQELEQDAEAVLDHQSTQTRELRTADGRWISRQVLPYRTETRRVDGVVVTFVDITHLKRVEAELRETEARFREMADGLPLIVWVHDDSGQQEYVNETFCEFFGVTREEMRGGRWQALLHPDDVDAYNREFLACLRERRSFHGEVRVQDAKGRWRWLESWGRPRRTDSGEFRGFIGASADITARKEMETALSRSEERFRNLADNIAQLAWMADNKGSNFWYNKRWYDYTGTTFEEVKGWGWQRVHHPDHVERVVTKIDACFEEGERWEDTFPLRAADGSYRWFLSRALPIRNESGQILRWFGTNTDITEQRNAEQQLRDADRQKDEYLAMLGHELRNPLAAIRTATDLLSLSKTEDPVLTRARDVLDRQTAHMAKLLDGLLDVSRIISGKIRLDIEVLDLAEICRTVLADAEITLNRRDLELRSELPPAPLWVEADPVRIAQVVDNLLANAIKFTPDGGMIRLCLVSQRGLAVLVVEDNGKGIEPELLPHVFETFRQSTQALDRAPGGLGLGLALVKSLVELQGGEVSAASEGPGQGATFVVRMPLSADEPRRPAPAPAPPEGPLRVLVIDDNQDAAMALGDLLTTVGYRVDLAYDGPQGVQLATEQQPDLVLCDIGLPDGMSGYDVVRALRDDARTRALAVVAATGYGDPDHVEQSRQAGFDAHLTKPIRLADVRRVAGELGLE